MVMFHPEIPYADALRRGSVQAEILAALDASASAAGAPDPDLATSLVNSRLTPVGRP